jgi:hypothetical protein
MLVAALLLALPSAPAPSPPADARTTVVLHEQCASRIDRRDLTLYANGTIRLREGPVGGERLVLREIGRPDVDAVRRRLQGIDLGSIESATGAPDGDWSLACSLEVVLDGLRHELRYGAFDVGGLALDELRRVVGDLLEQARAEAYSAEIPLSYRPAPGDRLERNDGLVFEVIGFTSDGKAIELTALDQPIQVFVERDKLRLEFRRLLPGREAR